MQRAISRRRAAMLMAAGLAGGFGKRGYAARDPANLRVASLGYEAAQTLLALGIVPLTATNPRGYAQWGGWPALPESVANVGLRTEPNLELLQMLRPDFIALGEGQVSNPDVLGRIAPVIALRLFSDADSPLQSGQAALLQLASQLGRSDQARLLLQELDAALQSGVKQDRPVFLATFIDATHLYVYGPQSLFGEVWARLGGLNAWTGPVNRWGFAILGPEHLASVPDTSLLHIGSLGDVTQGGLIASPLWQALPFSREGRLMDIPAVLPFGGAVSALRFARLVLRASHHG